MNGSLSDSPNDSKPVQRHLKRPVISTAPVSTVLALLLAAAVLLPLLGHKLMADWDEGIYAEIAREMLGRASSGSSWLVPTWNFHPWLEKPPLLFWITATFFRLFGVTEFWARAASALSGVGLVGVLHGWFARRGDRLAAWLSTLILLSTFGFLHVCRMGETDVLLSLACSVALCGLAAVDTGQTIGWYFFWGGFAAALMTKGAASVVLVLTAVAVATLGRWGWSRFGRPFWIGLVGFLLAVLPWHIAMWQRFGNTFLAEYLGFHALTRATHQIEGHVTHWWYYVWVVLVSAMPWVLLFPAAVWAGFKQTGLHVWAIFALLVLVFYSAVQTRLPHYIAPAYPALTLLTAAWVADRLRRLEAQWRRSPKAFWSAVAACAIAAWGLGALATSGPRKQLHSEYVNGRIIHEEKESLLMLRDVFRRPQPDGPVLVWREGDTRSIATVLFYTHRPVQQVQLGPLPADAATDKYVFSPRPLAEMVTTEPHVILLDKRLLTRLPQDMTYTPIASGQTMAVGLIQR